MRNRWYICLLALVLFACEQDDSFYYGEKAELYFVSALGDHAGSMSKTIDFAFRKTGKMDMNYMYPLYYGDSLRMDSVKLVVSLLGEVSDQPREYNLEVVFFMCTAITYNTKDFYFGRNHCRTIILVAE